MISILFICTANRYRSPLAAAFLTRELESRNEQSWMIDSAGTWALEGLPPLPEAIQLARKYGSDLQNYRSKQVNEGILHMADLVLCMELNHKEALRVEFPRFEEKIYCFSEAVENHFFDIPDVVGRKGSIDTQVGEEIHELIRSRIANILQFMRANTRL